MKKSYLTPIQVAELLLVTPSAVRQWAEKGELDCLTTPGGHRRFIPSDVERFASERGIKLHIRHSNVLRVLIIDDEQAVARYLVKVLAQFSGKVITQVANDGFVAGFKVREFKPDVVLLDLMMPDMNGFQICKLLKAGAETKTIRIIAMTGFRTKENVESIEAVGAEVCLAKPIDKDQLFNLLGLSENKITLVTPFSETNQL